MIVTKRRLNRKLDLLIARQNFLATILIFTTYDYDQQKKLEKKWNKLWNKFMEGK